MALNPQQRRFVAEYLVDLNGAAAARRAGYSAGSAKVTAARLLTNANVVAAIAEAQNRRAVRTEIKADAVVRELSLLAFSRMSSFARWGPAGVTLKDNSLLTEDEDSCVAEVSQTVTESGGTIKFKLHSKPAALDKLARHLGLYDKRTLLEKFLALFPPDDAEEIRRTYGDRFLAGAGAPGVPPAPAVPADPGIPPLG